MKSLGINIKRLRDEKEYTLRALAKSARISPSFLSQVEKGKASPSLDTLKRIATELDTTIGNLVGEQRGREEQMVTRVQDRKALKQVGTGIKMFLLTEPTPYKQLQPLLFSLGTNAISGEDTYSHYGQEFVIVLKGQLEINLGDKLYLLKKGDSIYFNSTTPHSFKNMQKGETEVLWVVTPPSF